MIFNLSLERRFPEGTSVALYPRSNWGPGQRLEGAPPGSATATETVTNGVAAFDVAEGDYVAYAKVSGEDRYVLVSVARPKGEPIRDSIIEAKGDLIAGANLSEPARVPAPETEGHVLTADPSEDTGMKWAAPTGEGGGITEEEDPIASAALETHEGLTENVHGIADTSDLVLDDDSRLTDARVPTDGSVTAAKIADALKPSEDASASTEALRALGTSAGTAAAGNDSRLPSADQKSALAGTSGTPGSGNKFVTNADSRLSDDRDPTAHASTHATGGSDAIAPGDIDAASEATLSGSGMGVVVYDSGTSSWPARGTDFAQYTFVGPGDPGPADMENGDVLIDTSGAA